MLLNDLSLIVLTVKDESYKEKLIHKSSREYFRLRQRRDWVFEITEISDGELGRVGSKKNYITHHFLVVVSWDLAGTDGPALLLDLM